MATNGHLQTGVQHDEVLARHRGSFTTVYNTLRGEQIIELGPRGSVAERENDMALNNWLDEASDLEHLIDLVIQKLSLQIAMIKYETDESCAGDVLRYGHIPFGYNTGNVGHVPFVACHSDYLTHIPCVMGWFQFPGVFVFFHPNIVEW